MSKKKQTSDRKAARIAEQVSRELSRAFAGIDLRTLGQPNKKPARQATQRQRRKQSIKPEHMQPTLFDLDKGGAK